MSRNCPVPTFRIEYTVPGFHYTPAAWPTKDAGRPTDVTLAKHIAHYEASCAPGGCNDHLGAQSVQSARVIRQSNNEIVATYTK